MNLFLEIIKFLIYSSAIVLISKYILVVTIRKLAQSLNLNSKTVRRYCWICHICARTINY